MPITTSAKKAVRQAVARRTLNRQRLSVMRSAVKSVRQEAATDKRRAATLLPAAFRAIDKSAKRGVIKKNAAARYKSRLAKLVAVK